MGRTCRSLERLCVCRRHLAGLHRQLDRNTSCLRTTLGATTYISDGALNISKCFGSLQYWECERGRPALRDIQPEDSPLVLYSGDNPEAAIIHRISNKDATKTLGAHFNILGTFKSHARALQSNTEGMTARLEGFHLNKALGMLH